VEVLYFVIFTWLWVELWGLTCVFSGIVRVGAPWEKLVVTPFGLHFGLRQSGGRFAAAFRREAEASLYLAVRAAATAEAKATTTARAEQEQEQQMQ